MFQLRSHPVLLWLSITLVQGVIFAASHHNEFDQKAWREAGEFLKEYMDPEQEPCENFYDHVCSKLWRSNKSKGISDFDDEGTKRARALVEENGHKSDSDLSRSEMMAKDFYNRCLKSESGTLEAIVENILQRRANESNLWRLLGYARRELGVHFGLKFEMESKPRLRMSQIAIYPNLFMMKEINERFRQISHERNLTHLQNRIDQFETLLQHAEASTQRPSPIKFATVSEGKTVTSIDLASYLDEWTSDGAMKKTLSDGSIKIVVVSLELVRAFADLLNDLGKDVVYDSILSVASMESGRLSGGLPAEVCTNMVMHHLTPIVAGLYLKSIKQDAAELRRDLDDLRDRIFGAFYSLLDNVDWMDEHDKDKILEKAKDIDFYTGLPDWIANETRLIEEASYFEWNDNISRIENEFSFTKIELERDLGILARSQDFHEIRFSFNPAYLRTTNQITVRFGATVPPEYQVKYPLAVKYGLLGAILGHELMHAFDGNNIVIPPPSIQGTEQWLTNDTHNEFDRKKQCCVRQYARECSRTKQACVGARTFSENMADIDGLKIAYAAYKFASQVSGKDPPIPSLKNHTQDQLFFVAYARHWCVSESSNEIFGEESHHSPDKVRVEVALKNVPTFARAFQCPMGSKYAPLKRCEMWGDMEDPPAKLFKSRLIQ